MPPELSRLTELRRLLMEEPDVEKVVRYFFDHLGDDPKLVDDSAPADHQALASILEQVGPRLVGAPDTTRVERLTTYRVLEQPFYHGGCLIAGHLVTFFYFDDIRTGALGAMSSLTGPIHFARFTATIQPGPPHPPGD